MFIKLNEETNPFKKRINMSETQIIAVGFVVIILTGALLLTLPFASRSGDSVGFVNALFTATTSTCVTGLVVVDTYTQWTLFGQIVILILIQTGGLGFMAIATLFSLLLNKKIGIKQRLIMSESISAESMAGIVRMMKKIIIGTVFFESMGAAFLSVRFIPEFGLANGIYKSIFHAVSAFCNAGLDLMGQKQPYSSLISYVGDPIVNITICSLIVIGGLGFTVWDDLLHFAKRRKLKLHTKLVLIITGALILTGAVLIFLFERNNPKTIMNMSVHEKFFASIFQSITPRTAGYNTLDIASMTNASIFVIMILMFIGGSPGSTAGGIKTTTFGVLVLTARCVLRGSSQVNVFGRKITSDHMLRAFAIVGMSIGIVCIGIALLFVFDDLDFKAAVFEAISAFGTVGLTMGITPSLSSASKIVLVCLMYFGRVGIITALLAIARNQTDYADRVSYPKEGVLL
ncbi:MAG: TrkH family potassium uptake protein [Clostridia bacterium]|nr:TrkH family potassium uptake protein [Clostridia bacterium]